MADARTIMAWKRERNRLAELVLDLEAELAQIEAFGAALHPSAAVTVAKKLALVRSQLAELTPR